MDAKGKSNMTGGQIQEALDFLIYHALEPIVLNSDVFNIQLVHLLGRAASNRKRKLSAMQREAFLTRLCNALVTQDREERMELIRGAKIERSFVHVFIVGWLNETGSYADNYMKWISCSNPTERQSLDRRLTVVEFNLGMDRSTLFPQIDIVRSYLDMAYEFRNMIVVNYVRHAYKQAKAFRESKPDMQKSTVSVQDLSQNLLVAVTKAVDKYDCSLGALTSYVNFWLLNAMTGTHPQHGHEYGVAYTIPQNLKKSLARGEHLEQGVNFSVSLDTVFGEDGSPLSDRLPGTEGVDKSIEKTQEMDLTLALIKSADPKGIARLYLDLDEHITGREKKIMKKTMRDQLGLSVKL